jgi:hypothetical protein
MTLVANLPLVSTTQFVTGINNNGSKFATSGK